MVVAKEWVVVDGGGKIIARHGLFNLLMPNYFLFNWSITNAKLILTDFLIQINIYQYLTVNYQYLVNIYIVKAIFNWSWPIFKQIFTNCMHGYDRAHNVHANGVIHAQKFVQGIDWECNRELLITCPHRRLCFNKIRATTTTAFLISNTAVSNLYSHSTAFNLQSFAPLPYV